MNKARNRGERVFKNTLALYFRMILMIVIRLYTSRILLEYLGVDNFGIYSLVGGVVILFSFIEPSMNGAIQRYFNTAIGKSDDLLLRRYFAASMAVFIGFVTLLFVIAELAGYYVVMDFLNIPERSKVSAYLAYHMFVITTMFTVMRSPFNALIIANEEMSFYAVMSLIEATLQLSVIWLLPHMPLNVLESYSVLITIIAFICFVCYYIKCKLRWPEVISAKFKEGKQYVKEICSFSLWGSFSSLANVGTKQGFNIIVNLFYGIALNASIGVMNQVTSAVYGFVSNLQTAFNPQLIKSYAGGEYEYLTKISYTASKCSFYLLLTLSFPLIYNIRFILSIWLKDIPPFTGSLCIFALVALFCNTFGGVVWTLIQAIGKIRNYQLIISCIIIVNLPIYYLLGYYGFKIEYLLGSNIIINACITAVGVAKCARAGLFPLKGYMDKVIGPCVLVTVLSVLCLLLVNKLLGQCISSEMTLGIISVLVDFVAVVSLIVVLGLSKQEKAYLKKVIKKNSTT